MSELSAKAVMQPLSASGSLASPHGGMLIDRMVSVAERQELLEEAARLDSLQISPLSAAHLAMLASGAFSPLNRFLGERDYRSVVEHMRTTDGAICPLPITLPAGENPLPAGSRIALRDRQNRLLACMTVEETFEVRHSESRHSRGGKSGYSWSERAISGPLQVLQTPADHQFPAMWLDPSSVRQQLLRSGCNAAIAVDHWDPQDNQSTQWLNNIARQRNATLLLNLAGADQRIDTLCHFQHLRECREAFAHSFSPQRSMLNFVRLEPSLLTERQILWHAIVHKNYGASSYVVDSSCCQTERTSYRGTALEDSKLLHDGAAEVGVELIFHHASVTDHSKSFPSTNTEPQGFPEGTSARSGPNAGTNNSQTATLQPTSESGLCLWFTGLPCSGKSTIAEQLLVLFMERGLRVTLLDGDTVRNHLSKGLSFSKEDRDTNVQRIGFVASEIVRHGGVVICAAVSPWRQTREQVRQMMPSGTFVEIYVDTPIEECERRDVKGYFAQARSGLIPHFTGVSDPYEPPLQPEIILQTMDATERENAISLLHFLTAEKYLS